jgi:DNA repair protein RadC
VTNACKTMEMQLLDHIIIGAGSYYSFSDEVTTKFKTK